MAEHAADEGTADDLRCLAAQRSQGVAEIEESYRQLSKHVELLIREGAYTKDAGSKRLVALAKLKDNSVRTVHACPLAKFKIPLAVYAARDEFREEAAVDRQVAEVWWASKAAPPPHKAAPAKPPKSLGLSAAYQAGQAAQQRRVGSR